MFSTYETDELSVPDTKVASHFHLYLILDDKFRFRGWAGGIRHLMLPTRSGFFCTAGHLWNKTLFAASGHEPIAI